jgi:hypothetical protein
MFPIIIITFADPYQVFQHGTSIFHQASILFYILAFHATDSLNQNSSTCQSILPLLMRLLLLHLSNDTPIAESTSLQTMPNCFHSINILIVPLSSNRFQIILPSDYRWARVVVHWTCLRLLSRQIHGCKRLWTVDSRSLCNSHWVLRRITIQAFGRGSHLSTTWWLGMVRPRHWRALTSMNEPLSLP